MKTAAIIILYNPDSEKVSRLAETANASGCTVIAVDNTPGKAAFVCAHSQWVYLPLCANTGIAHAQNVGLRKARELGCEYVIFFDQDSRISPNFCNELLEAYQRLEKLDPQVFILGPRVIDAYNEKAADGSFLEQEFVLKNRLISSGSIVSLEKVGQVGEMDDAMFIDWVDLEYIWRGYREHLNSYMAPGITMVHPIGQRSIYLLGKRLDVSAPIRYYYQYRNYLYLLGRGYVPLRWKCKVGILMLFQYLFFPFVQSDWRKIHYYMRLGLRDGAAGKSGPIANELVK